MTVYPHGGVPTCGYTHMVVYPHGGATTYGGVPTYGGALYPHRDVLT